MGSITIIIQGWDHHRGVRDGPDGSQALVNAIAIDCISRLAVAVALAHCRTLSAQALRRTVTVAVVLAG